MLVAGKSSQSNTDQSKVCKLLSKARPKLALDWSYVQKIDRATDPSGELSPLNYSTLRDQIGSTWPLLFHKPAPAPWTFLALVSDSSIVLEDSSSRWSITPEGIFAAEFFQVKSGVIRSFSAFVFILG